MIAHEHYIEEGLKIIKTLISQGNLQAALHASQELLKVNPYDRKVQKYLKKIEERIIEENAAKVDSDLDRTMHLWKEGRFNELLNIYATLYQYAPEHRRLKRLLLKLNETLGGQQKKERETFINAALQAIASLLREKRFGDSIQACNELLSFDPLNRAARNFLKKAKNQLIEQKLRDHERILESADFERALEFYQTILAIDPNHPRVKQLAMQAKAHLAEKKLLASKIHFNESILRMKDLFSHGEYEKVLQACEEIDRLDAGNFTAKIFKEKAKAALHHEIEEKMLQQLKESWLTLESMYKKNPGAFVKV